MASEAAFAPSLLDEDLLSKDATPKSASAADFFPPPSPASGATGDGVVPQISAAATAAEMNHQLMRSLHVRYADHQTEHAVVILEDTGAGGDLISTITCAHMNAKAIATFGADRSGEQTGFFGAPAYAEVDRAELEELRVGVESGAGATVHYHCRVAGGEAALFTTTARGRLPIFPPFPFSFCIIVHR